MNVLMLYPKFPAETFWNTARTGWLLRHEAAVQPPLGLLTVAAYLPDDFRARLVDRNVSEETDADWAWADVVFLSLMVGQQRDYAICVARARTHGVPIAVGGPFTHSKPEVAVADADWVCFGEAESIIDQLIADLRADHRGKQYHGSDAVDMHAVRLPRFDLLPRLADYTCMAVQFSRGCPFRCEFCDIIEIYGRVPRTKTPAQILAELTSLKDLGFRGYVFIVDDNFIGNRRRAREMLLELGRWNRDNGLPFRFFTEATINLADDEELLEAMAQANFLHVFIGIETPDPALLKTALKLQNIPGHPLDKLRRIRAHGIHVTAGFIIGFDGETRQVFDVQRAFIRDSGIGIAMVGLLQAIPHTQLHRRLQREGRLLEQIDVQVVTTVEGLNFVPKGELTKREYLEHYRDLVREVYAPRAYFERILPALAALRDTTPWRWRLAEWRRDGIVFCRGVYALGVKHRDVRPYFWKTLLRLVWRNPAALEAFGLDCFYFLHLRQHADHVQRELSRYLAAPAPDDVLDEVISSARAPETVGKTVD